MKRIALYGYGVFGKRTAQSFLYFWGGEYIVTAIFDRDRAGEYDKYWGLRILSPDRLSEVYNSKVFESVMVCISDETIRTSVKKHILSLDIPVFLPGDPESFAEPGSFQEDGTPGIVLQRDNYDFHVYTNMLGATADFARWQIIFLFDEKGRLNIENYRSYKEVFEPLLLMYPFRLRNPVPEKIYMPGSYCIIAKAFSPNYWHFTFEMADCVYLLEKAGYQGKYIFNDIPFARELLQIMGVGPDRLIATKDLKIHKVYVFERLLEISRTGMQRMKCSVDVVSEMADFFKSKLKRDGNSPRKIYIKRIGRRKLLNGEEIAVRNGFRVIVPEEYSVWDQMSLFYNADIVLCSHGANSANCLYMRKGAVFAEIFSDRWQAAINTDICAANGVHYLQLTGKAMPDATENIESINADYTVDDEAFQCMILRAEQIIADNPPLNI